MSADGWSICPRCLKRAKAEYAAMLEQIDSSSRTGTSEAILKAARAGLKVPNGEDHRTFREEYEFFVTESGVVESDYYGECEKCGLSVGFQEKHPIPGVQEDVS